MTLMTRSARSPARTAWSRRVLSPSTVPCLSGLWSSPSRPDAERNALHAGHGHGHRHGIGTGSASLRRVSARSLRVRRSAPSVSDAFSPVRSRARVRLRAAQADKVWRWLPPRYLAPLTSLYHFYAFPFCSPLVVALFVTRPLCGVRHDYQYPLSIINFQAMSHARGTHPLWRSRLRVLLVVCQLSPRRLCGLPRTEGGQRHAQGEEITIPAQGAGGIEGCDFHLACLRGLVEVKPDCA